MRATEELSFEKLPRTISQLMIDVDEIKKLLISNRAREEPILEKLSTEKALVFIRSKGYSMSKSKFYKLSADKKLPTYKFGNKLVFDEKELIIWLESQTHKTHKSYQDSFLNISASARNKISKI